MPDSYVGASRAPVATTFERKPNCVNRMYFGRPTPYTIYANLSCSSMARHNAIPSLLVKHSENHGPWSACACVPCGRTGARGCDNTDRRAGGVVRGVCGGDIGRHDRAIARIRPSMTFDLHPEKMHGLRLGKRLSSNMAQVIPLRCRPGRNQPEFCRKTCGYGRNKRKFGRNKPNIPLWPQLGDAG